MRFLVDECTGPAVASWLRKRGHEIFSVYESARGLGDDDILKKAYAENWIIITNDKDFGEKIVRQKRSHRGVILMRLADERAANKIAVLDKLLASYPEDLKDRFIVTTEFKIRVSID